MLDPLSGRAYEYSIDRGCFLKCFERRPSVLQVHMLHFAIVHMQDAELTDQILVFLCRRLPHNLSNQLLKEFLLGVSFHHALHNLKLPAHLLDCFPLSSLPALEPNGATVQHAAFSISCKSLLPAAPAGSSKRQGSTDALSISSPPSTPSSSSLRSTAIQLTGSPLQPVIAATAAASGLLPGSPQPSAALLSSSPSFNPLLKFDHHHALQGAPKSASAPRFQFHDTEEGVVIRNSAEMSEEPIPSSTPAPFPPASQSTDRLHTGPLASSLSFSASSLKRFVAFFSPEKAPGAGSSTPPRAALSSSELVDRHDYIEAIVSHWHSVYPRENQAKLLELAKQYRIGQMNAVKRLFRHVRSGLAAAWRQDPSAHPEELFQAPSQEMYSHFYVLETLYSVLEELFLPFPNHFQQLRFFLGFQCLALELFIQYLHSDIIFPSFADIRCLITALATQPSNPRPFDVNGRLERALLNRLSFKQQVSILTGLAPSPAIDRYLSEIFTFFSPLRPHFIDYELSEDSAFVPLSVWEEALRIMCPDSPVSSQRAITYHQFLTKSAQTLYAPILGNPQPPRSPSAAADGLSG